MNVKLITTSVDTNPLERDKYLRSADFSSKYPGPFTSTSVKKDGDELDITGDLTLDGTPAHHQRNNWSG